MVFRHEAPFDRSSLTRWRQRLGEEHITALLQESLSVAHRIGAIETRAWLNSDHARNLRPPVQARRCRQARSVRKEPWPLLTGSISPVAKGVPGETSPEAIVVFRVSNLDLTFAVDVSMLHGQCTTLLSKTVKTARRKPS